MTALRAAAASLLVLLLAAPLCAEPVAVRMKEGNARGFLVVETPAGEALGHGELIQEPAGEWIKSRLTLRFANGSLYDEIVTFSQQRVFRIEAYSLVQRGPWFPGSNIKFDRKSRRYTAKVAPSKGAEDESASGELEMPADLYNGMALTLLKNLPAGAGIAGRMAVFTPKARLIDMGLAQESSGSVKLGGAPLPVTQYLVKLEIGGLTGVVASLIGKEPPDLRYWIVGGGPIPGFGKFEGPMFLKGPIWRIRQTLVDWPR